VNRAESEITSAIKPIEPDTNPNISSLDNPFLSSDCEASLLVSALEGSGEAGKAVEQASNEIIRLAKASEVAHRDMLYALFTAMFGAQTRVVTSEDIARRGVDDSQEPNIWDYYDYL
jgi:hypothetical protein